MLGYAEMQVCGLSRSELCARLGETEYRAEPPLTSYAVASKAEWPSPSSVNADYRNASIVAKDRAAFNIGGNGCRLVVRFDYGRRIGFVRFVGTHAEYDGIDAFRV